MLFRKKISNLGIDIGTSSIKVVELEKEGKIVSLKNYAEYRPLSLEKKLFLIESKGFFFFEKDLPAILAELLRKANITQKKAVFSLPVFSSFFAVIELPSMDPEEIPGAINFQAQQYIPIPLSEVILDWQIIEEEKKEFKEKLKILLVASPKEVVEKYFTLARRVGLEIKSLEIESFSIQRAILKEKKDPYVIVDIGGGTTSVTIVDKGFIRICHSIESHGFEQTQLISKQFNISLLRAEQLKREKGIKEESNLLSAVLPSLEKIAFGVERAIMMYKVSSPKREIKKIILTGGGALLSGIEDFFAEKFKKEVEIANPFSQLVYPSVLEKKLKKIGPLFTTAVGLALNF